MSENNNKILVVIFVIIPILLIPTTLLVIYTFPTETAQPLTPLSVSPTLTVNIQEVAIQPKTYYDFSNLVHIIQEIDFDKSYFINGVILSKSWNDSNGRGFLFATSKGQIEANDFKDIVCFITLDYSYYNQFKIGSVFNLTDVSSNGGMFVVENTWVLGYTSVDISDEIINVERPFDYSWNYRTVINEANRRYSISYSVPTGRGGNTNGYYDGNGVWKPRSIMDPRNPVFWGVFGGLFG